MEKCTWSKYFHSTNIFLKYSKYDKHILIYFELIDIVKKIIIREAKYYKQTIYTEY